MYEHFEDLEMELCFGGSGVSLFMYHLQPPTAFKSVNKYSSLHLFPHVCLPFNKPAFIGVPYSKQSRTLALPPYISHLNPLEFMSLLVFTLCVGVCRFTSWSIRSAPCSAVVASGATATLRMGAPDHPSELTRPWPAGALPQWGVHLHGLTEALGVRH